MTETSSSRAGRRAVDGEVGDDPFGLLGLEPRPGLSDDDVRAAWRRIAAATHPDREDGGDPARFGAAAGAYVVLRTEFGRGEALADLGLNETTDQRGPHARRRRRSAYPAVQGTGRHRARRRRSPRWLSRPVPRPGGLALRVTGVAALALVAIAISGWSPGVVGVLAGVLTWLLAIAGRACARRRSQPPS